MDCQYLPLESTGQFSPLFLDYLAQKDSLRSFYSQFPDLAAFEEQIQNRSFDPKKRKVLVDALNRQYQSIDHKPDFSVLLDTNTFAVTTGHQLNIFTGPLYIIYKLVTTIKLARKLKENVPEL